MADISDDGTNSFRSESIDQSTVRQNHFYEVWRRHINDLPDSEFSIVRELVERRAKADDARRPSIIDLMSLEELEEFRENSERKILAEGQRQQEQEEAERKSRKKPEDFLRLLLQRGECKVTIILTKAKAADYSKRTMDRAKIKLGVISRQKVFHGPWFWRLPQKSA